jgi:Holliday junction resolvase
MGKKSRDKGARNERGLVNDLLALGVEAERVPLSGSAGGSFTGDVRVNVPVLGELLAEAKVRASGFRQLYQWLDGVDVLFVRADRQPAIVCLPWSTWERVLTVLKEMASPVVGTDRDNSAGF